MLKVGNVEMEFMSRKVLSSRARSLPGEDLLHRVLRSSVFHFRQGYGGHVGLRSAQRGFTLIELLVAMALLMIIVLMLSNLFQQSTRAWGLGIHYTSEGLEARAAMNLIQRELSMSIPNPAGGAGSFFKLDADGTLVPLSLGGGSVVSIDIVPISDDLVEIVATVQMQTRATGMRVFAFGRGHDSGRPLEEVVDTSGGE